MFRQCSIVRVIAELYCIFYVAFELSFFLLKLSFTVNILHCLYLGRLANKIHHSKFSSDYTCKFFSLFFSYLHHFGRVKNGTRDRYIFWKILIVLHCSIQLREYLIITV